MRELAAHEPDVRLSLGVPLSHAARTDVGRVRANNEDAHGATWLGDGSLLVTVCDGMGGHEAGEVASRLAVEEIERVVAEGATASPQAVLYDALLAANRAILEEGRQASRRGMGTTAVIAWIRGEEVHVGLVGDSRLYLVRDGRVAERTVDHTRVQSLVAKGVIRPDEARDHPEAGMLTRALGHARMSNGRPLEPEVFAAPLRLGPGDALVLATDGLHDLVDDWEVAAAVAGEGAEPATHALVELALERGGFDNVTVAVVVHGARAADAEVGGDDETAPVPRLQVPAPAAAPPVAAPHPAVSGDDRLLLLAAAGGVLMLVSLAMLVVAAVFALW